MEKTALISVSDKTDVEDFVEGLIALDDDWRILSTGGTAIELRKAGIEVTDVSVFTGSPECLDGRVKTLHPKIFAGLLATSSEADVAQMADLGFEYIDLVACNLYPFQKTVAKTGATDEEIIENIDVGGPSMLRAGSKNWERVTAICDPANYPEVLKELREDGAVSPRLRQSLAYQVFRHTAEYDKAIAEWWLTKQAS